MTDYTQYAIELYKKQGYGLFKYELLKEVEDDFFIVIRHSKRYTSELIYVFVTHKGEKLTKKQMEKLKEYFGGDFSGRVDLCKIVLNDKGEVKYTKIITNIINYQIY